MLYLYPETSEILNKIQELDPSFDEETLKELENILFVFYDQTYCKGMTDAFISLPRLHKLVEYHE
jgi:hypothetical protein